LYRLRINNIKIIKGYKAASIYKRIIYYNVRYNTVVKEGGIKFLGGECQRIIIARAFLKNLKILLFNETIFIINNITKKLIYESFKSWGKG